MTWYKVKRIEAVANRSSETVQIPQDAVGIRIERVEGNIVRIFWLEPEKIEDKRLERGRP